MPDTKKVFIKRFNEAGVGDLLYLVLLLAVAGTVFMAWNEVKAGIVYFILMSSSVAILFLVTLLRKDEDKPTDAIPLPFVKRFSVSVVMFLSGFMIRLLLGLVLGLFGLSILGFSIPLFSNELAVSSQSFAVANLEGQMSTRIFNIVFVAGTIETLVYNWLAMLFGILAGQVILKLASSSNKVNPKSMGVKVFAYGFSALVFLASHVLNNTYDSILPFIVAGTFLLISNISIFEFGIPMTFWIGFHQANNLVYLIGIFGLATVLSGFLGIFGVIISVIVGLMLFYIINQWDVVRKDWKWFWKS